MQKQQGYTTIDEYIETFPAPIQKKLKTIRELIQKVAPDAQEKISYRMPTFFLNGNLVHFAAHTEHIGFYPTPSGVSKFKQELSKYETSKGAVQFPMAEALPIELIKKIVQFRVQENRTKGRK
jgi:uncharacterized protein YdhG (YjbR/CyaY superfamily)